MYGDQAQGDPADPLETLAQFPPEMLALGLKLLAWLEAIDWKWDIVTLLNQPMELLELVFMLKSLGVDIREELRKQNQKGDGHV